MPAWTAADALYAEINAGCLQDTSEAAVEHPSDLLDRYKAAKRRAT